MFITWTSYHDWVFESSKARGADFSFEGRRFVLVALVPVIAYLLLFDKFG